jgi:trimeric autotransporter adhesin
MAAVRLLRFPEVILMQRAAIALTLFVLFASWPVCAQNISTIVGGGNPTGSALSAYVAGPTDVVKDSHGNVYISTIDELYVLKLDTAGNVTVVAGTGYSGWGGVDGPANNAILSGPTGLALDSHGNLFIADDFNQHVYEVNASTGVLTSVAGSTGPASPLGGYSGDGGPATKAQLNAPQGVAVLMGYVAIADASNNVVRVIKPNGIIVTYAGVQSTPCPNPTSRCGDGGPATQANLNYPVSVAVDTTGNLYIADSLDNRIRRVSRAGIITTVAGNGDTCTLPACGDGLAATKANLNYPAKVFVDHAGNLYIADENDGKIRFVNANTHIISTVAGNGGYGFSGDGGLATLASFADPTGLFVDSEGNILVADQGSDRIREVTSGKIKSIAGGGSGGDGGPATGAVFSYSYDVAVDSARGHLFVIDKDTGRIRLVDQVTKQITTVAGNGTNGYTGDGGPATAATLDYPRGVALNSAGDLFIADSDNWVVRLVTNGTINTYAGNGDGCFPATSTCGDGGPAAEANLTDPQGVVLDSAGNLYIADTLDNKIRKVENTAQHTISTVAGTGNACAAGTDKCGDNGPATSADLNTPTGIAIDSKGNLFIADYMDNRIRRIDAATQEITTVAFTGQASFGGDGGPATLASMTLPAKVAVDSSGNLYIGGGLDEVVQRVDAASGIVTTVAGNANDPLPFGFSGDGGPATEATLSNRGLAVDTAGGLYIADNNRVRYVDVGLSGADH